MKKIILTVLILFVQFIFAAEHNQGNGMYKYYNSNGSLDWDTFYARWDEVPDSYYIYLWSIRWNSDIGTPMLWKDVSSTLPMFRNNIVFICEGRRSKLQIIFSPNNYSNAEIAALNYIRIGLKRNNYGVAIEQWNFMLNHVE